MKARPGISYYDLRTPRDRRAFDHVLACRRDRSDEQLAQARAIVDGVRGRGDRALIEYTAQFDAVRLSAGSLRVSAAELKRLALEVGAPLRGALVQAIKRIRAYHKNQAMRAFSMKTPEGTLEQMIRPLLRVGVYVPGGHTVYPSSILMNVIPAQVAGVEQIAVVTPPRDGLNPVLACAFELLGITEVYRVGGAQAIAALAYGTKTIPAVDKIVGPGRNVVALAKRLVYGVVDIDMVAGASEVAILADSSAKAEWIALDMLAQAEHGSGDELAVLVCESAALARRVNTCLKAEIERSPARKVFSRLKPSALCLCVTKSRDESLALVNALAPEHLQIVTRTARKDLARVRNAGAVFIGPYTPVALGDYYIGTNHVLPTSGAARFASALGTDDFQKRISVASVDGAGLARAARNVSLLARSEGFVHHALSVERRDGC